MPIVFKTPEERYIRSYWETLGEICAENGYERIELKAWKSNIWAIHLYEKTGFVKTDEDKETLTMSFDI